MSEYVYVVSAWVRYEGSCIIGVYKTKELAIEKCKHWEDSLPKYQVEGAYQGAVWEEWEVYAT